ncbi:glycosyltransferase [Mariniflexile sp.]|uniref:glycosyltransferase n=1 Tax=Mariniflexile sp. TaxID=1979402 RepID=UPI003561CF40
MNIAIFSPNQNPYSETFIQAHKAYLKGNIFYYYGSKGDVKLEGTPRLISKFKRITLNIIRKLTKKQHTYVNDISLLLSLKKNNINVLLVEYGTHAYNLLKIFKQSKLPFIVHFHGYDASVKAVIKDCNCYDEVFKAAAKIIVVSKKMEQQIISMGCPKSKVVYNVYGPHPDYELVNPNFSKQQFLFVGRLTDKKAPYYTIIAFKQVVEKYPNAKLLIAGNGILFNVCKNLIQMYKLESNVKLLGIITPFEYRELLSNSLAFVQHSITAEDGDMEGTPLAVLEASAAGLPVISTIHAGIPDVILNETTGFLVTEHDVDAMAEKMILLLNNKELAMHLGNNGKNRIKTHFTLKRHIDVIDNLLEEASV